MSPLWGKVPQTPKGRVQSQTGFLSPLFRRASCVPSTISKSRNWSEGPSDLPVTSLVAQMVKCLSTMQETWVWSLGWEVPWRRKWQPTPVLLPRKSHRRRSLVSMGSQRVGHDWATSLHYCCPGGCHEGSTREYTSLVHNSNSLHTLFFLPSIHCPLARKCVQHWVPVLWSKRL